MNLVRLIYSYIILVLYERRFKTTVYHIIKLHDIHLFKYPEISQYNHGYFEDKINYVYFLYVLKGLIKMPHVQLIQKILSFIYYNEDFFNGKHRLQVSPEIPPILTCSYIVRLFSLILLISLHIGILMFVISFIVFVFINYSVLVYLIYLVILPVGSFIGIVNRIVEIENELYNRIFEHKKEMRKRKESMLQEDIIEEEDENNVFSFDKEGRREKLEGNYFIGQQRIWNHFDYDAYSKSQSSRIIKQNMNKMSITLQLSDYRETQLIIKLRINK